MPLFKKRETAIQNITYMAIMAAINVVFTLLTTLVPLLMFLIIFVLPLTSTVVALFCKKKFYPIYAIVTIGLCALVTLWNISDTFFYVVPSIVTGFIIALMVERKINSLWVIIVTSILQTGFSFAFIPIINLIYGRNFVEDFATIFGLGSYQYFSYIVPAIIFTISIIQSAFAYLVISDEIKKLGVESNGKEINTKYLMIFQLLILALIILFAFLYPVPTLSLFILFVLISMYFIVDSLSKCNRWVIICLAISFFVTIFVFASLYKIVPQPLSILLVGTFFVLGSIIGLINNYFFIRRSEKSKIE